MTRDFEIGNYTNIMRLLLDMMMRMTEEKHNTIKLIHGTTGSMCSIAQMLIGSVRLAAHWRLSDHVRPGDIVTIALDNHPQYYTPVMAAWLCGAGVSLIGHDTPVNTIASMLSLSQSGVVVISPSRARALPTEDLQLLQNKCDKILKFYSLEFGNETVENITTVVNDPKMDSKRMNINDDDMETNLDDIAAIFWSSGTTGHPKGIRYTHRHFLLSVLLRKVDQNAPLTLTSNCLYHGSTFPLVLNCLIVNSTSVIIVDANCSSLQILQAIHDWSPGRAIVPSFHLAQIASFTDTATTSRRLSLKSLQVIATAGAPVPIKYELMLREKHPNLRRVVNLYGLTELGLISRSESLASIGKPVAGVDVKIIDPDTGKLVVEGNPGELCVKSSQRIDGYLGSEETLWDNDGWAHTGDLVIRNKDGNMVFVDRIKSLIKYEAKYVQPAEIESLIMKDSNVREAAVFGVPDPLHQDLVAAAVVLVDDSQNFDVDNLIESVNEKLDRHKRIRNGILVLSNLPRNSMGKVLRRELVTMFQRSRKMIRQDGSRTKEHEMNIERER